LKKQSGLSLIEVLITMVIVAILFIPMIEMLNNAFMAEYANRVNIEAKELRESTFNRMFSNLREASYIYPDDTHLYVASESGMLSLIIGENAFAALVPVFEDGEDVTSVTSRTFKGYAYGIVNAYEYGSDIAGGSEKKFLIEAYAEMTCDVDDDNTAVPDSAYGCSIFWPGEDYATTTILVEDIKEADFTNFTEPFDTSTSGNIEVTLATKEGVVYYPGEYGPTIDDKFVHSIDIFSRNLAY
jgi:prepilin-type N-terminal cleavage/methylation domain-containing protein